MIVHKTDAFILDIERQFEWYQKNADLEVADAYLKAVERSCELLGKHPHLGSAGRFRNPRLSGWRFLS
jgi:plasmid stabilization system protein ParE